MQAGNYPARTIYGRHREMAFLMDAIHRASALTHAELVLLRGPEGIGKTALFQALQQHGLPGQIMLAYGGCDTAGLCIPYSSLAQAMEALLATVDALPALQQEAWKARLREAIYPCAYLIASVVPRLEALMGPQPEIAELVSQDAEMRFFTCLARFLKVFASRERPLIVFLDDVHLADSSTLDAIEYLVTEAEITPVLIVATCGAEVDAHSALANLLDKLQRRSGLLHEHLLQPLDPQALADSVAQATGCDGHVADRQPCDVAQDMAGNPGKAIWHSRAGEAGLPAPTWPEMERGCGVESGVINGQLPVDAGLRPHIALAFGKLPASTQALLAHMSCLGTAGTLDDLHLVADHEVANLQEVLPSAACAGFIEMSENGWRFSSGSTREVAASWLDAATEYNLHRRAGLGLSGSLSPSQLVARIFSVVGHLNAAPDHGAGQAWRDRLAELNLIAARRAKTCAAYEAALHYLRKGLQLLAPSSWNDRYIVAFALHINHAECEVATRHAEGAERLLEQLLPHAQSFPDRAAVGRLLMTIHSGRQDYGTAIRVASRCLEEVGIRIPLRPLASDLDALHQQVLRELDALPIESIIDLPLATDRMAESACGVLDELFIPAWYTDERLALLHLCHTIKLTLRYGLTQEAVQGMARFGLLSGHRYGRHAEGYRIVGLARQLVERHKFSALEAKSFFFLEMASGWLSPFESALSFSRSAFDAGRERGDLGSACFSRLHAVAIMLMRGDPLDVVQRELESAVGFTVRAGFMGIAEGLKSQLWFVRQLRLPAADHADAPPDDDLNARANAHAFRAWDIPVMAFWDALLRAGAAFLSGQWHHAESALGECASLAWTSPVHVQYSEYPFLRVLVTSASACADNLPDPAAFGEVQTCRETIAGWSVECPGHFAGKLALVDAEIARLQGRTLDAAALYQRAIDHARSSGLISVEAMAHEMASQFYAGLGLGSLSEACTVNAWRAYLRWGASAKARAMEKAFSFLAGSAKGDGGLADGTVVFRAQDSESARSEVPQAIQMANIAQQLSGEIRHEHLVRRMITMVIEHTGADFALLLLPRGGQWQLEVQGRAAADGVLVEVRQMPMTDLHVPPGMLQQVVRTLKPAIWDGSSGLQLMAGAHGGAVCMPLLRQQTLAGVFYLTNGHERGQFDSVRLALLELLASQAAISLENARLYADLERENRQRRITDRESARMQLALKESEAKFRRMTDATLDCIWITDLVPERVVYASPSFERMWGRTVEDLYREPRLWVDGIHPDDRERIHREFSSWTGSGVSKPWEAQFRIVRPDGVVRWIHERGVMMPEGRNQQVSGISTDITQRVEAELALRESEQRFALAVAGSNDGIWDWDTGSGRMFMSDRAQKVCDIPAGPATRSWTEWLAVIDLHPEDAGPFNAMLQEFGRAAISAHDGEFRVRLSEGGFRWIRWRGMGVGDARERSHRVAGSVGDIDVQKRTEAVLQQTQRLEAVGTLAAGIAHDFNNIVAAILGFGSMALQASRPGSRTRQHIASILTAGERGRCLVEQILTFSGNGRVQRTPVHVEGVVREALEFLAASWPSENVTTRIELNAGRAAIFGDSTRLHQVVMNLATNALHAMPSGGVLSISLRVEKMDSSRTLTTGSLQAAEYLLLVVGDTGTGIAENVVTQVFDPFFTTKEVGQGTGLGLSLVHSIVTEWGGAVDLSTEVDHGSVFTVYLPTYREMAPDTRVSFHGTKPPSRGAGPKDQAQRILLIDDEEAILEIMVDTLRQLGYEAVTFTSAAQAVAAFAADPGSFHAVITDERMPEMSGLAVIGKLRAIRPSLPVLLATGFPGSAIGARAQAAGACGMLGKPVNQQELEAALDAMLAPLLPGLSSPPGHI
ncbi:MAG: AAA family ATPase [Polaromonas sp.]|nr:AAA family ATPase [Polaromonas sp.]